MACVRSGQGHGLPEGSRLDGLAFLAAPFLPGELVAVNQKTNMRHCHAVVLDSPADGGHVPLQGEAGGGDDNFQGDSSHVTSYPHHALCVDELRVAVSIMSW